MEQNLVKDIAICIIAAWLVAVGSQLLKQPLLLAYLVAGFAISEHGFGFVTNHHSIETISEIGLSLLLFMIGLEIDLKKMVSAGKIITLTAASQILGCTALGWIFFRFCWPGGNWLEGLYLAIAAAMSSTVIIIKILYEKRELETLAGRVTLGVLVLQDLGTILFLAVQPNLKNPAVGIMMLAMGKVVLLVAVGLLVSKFILPPIFKAVARLPELVLVGALAWCFAMAGFAAWLDLSTAMGALVAGVALSTFPYTLDVIAKVTGIRDFFVTLFFVSLGMTIPVPTPYFIMWMLIVSAFLIGSRLVTTFFPLYYMKQGYRVSLLPAINLCQMSELSLVLLTLGRKSGDVSENSLSICAFAFAFLAVDSTYAVFRNDLILRKTIPLLDKFGLHDIGGVGPEKVAEEEVKRICLLGFSWTASSLLEEISRQKSALLKDILVVDFNPQVYDQLRRRGVHVVYGDIAGRDVLLHAGVGKAEIIICSLPNMVLKGASNMKLLRQLRELNPAAQIIVHAELLTDIPLLYAAGANYVSAPRLLEAIDLLNAIEVVEKNLLTQKRSDQADQLEDRNECIP